LPPRARSCSSGGLAAVLLTVARVHAPDPAERVGHVMSVDRGLRDRLDHVPVLDDVAILDPKDVDDHLRGAPGGVRCR
jgi:hypothetical protein